MARLVAYAIASFSLLTVTMLSAACNGLTGVGDLAESPLSTDADAGVGGDTTPPSTLSDSGGGADTAPPVIPDPPKACPSAGRRCAPTAPDGWQGPLIMYEGAANASPACPTSMALTKVDAHAGQANAPISCAKCSCGPVTGVTCSGSVQQFTNDMCAGAPASTTALSLTCQALAANVVAVVINTQASGGSCIASGGAVTKDPVTWPTSLRACGAPSLLADGCESGEVCVPDPPAPFAGQHCITHDGDIACPAPWNEQHKGSNDADDTRDCSKCGCKAPSSVDCNGTGRYSVADDPMCAVGSSTNKPIPGGCEVIGLGGSVKQAFNTTINPSGGFCGKTTGDSQPIGAVTPKTPVTVCCLAN